MIYFRRLSIYFHLGPLIAIVAGTVCIKQFVKLENLYLSGTGVKKIEGLENNGKLEQLYLSGTGVKKIEGLENNVNLNRLYLIDTGVLKSDCDEFKEARPRVSLSC
jgi:hypothetical protein